MPMWRLPYRQVMRLVGMSFPDVSLSRKRSSNRNLALVPRIGVSALAAGSSPECLTSFALFAGTSSRASYNSIIPRCTAAVTASVRSATWSFAMMFFK